MILMYHKVDLITPSRWWVSVSVFVEQMELLAQRFTLVYLDDYDPTDPSQVVITFDDAYENVFHHAFPELRRLGLPFEIFVIGNMIGEWNDFDAGELKTRFCSRAQLREMADCGGRVQFHSNSHIGLAGISAGRLDRELEIEPGLLRDFPAPHLKWFSLPYGYPDDSAIESVKSTFRGAVSVENGSDFDRFQLNRVTVTNDWLPGTTDQPAEA